MEAATLSKWEAFYEKYPQLQVKPQATKPEVKRFELLDQQDSSFVKESTRGTVAEQRLKAPSARYIMPEATVMLKTGEAIAVRYIPGANTIIKEEQIEKNINFVRAASEVVLAHGALAVANDFQNAALFTFLSNFSGNKQSPFKADHLDKVIFEYVPEKIAAQDLKLEDKKRKAKDLVYALYDSEKGTFEEEKILMMCNIFGVKAGGFAEKVQGLLGWADRIPEQFIESVGAIDKVYLANMRESIQSGVISVDGDKATLLSTNTPFYSFDAKKNDLKEKELVRFFLSEKGTPHYQQMMIDLDHKKKSALHEVNK